MKCYIDITAKSVLNNKENKRINDEKEKINITSQNILYNHKQKRRAKNRLGRK